MVDGEDDLEDDDQAAEKHVIINMWTKYDCSKHWTHYLP